MKTHKQIILLLNDMGGGILNTEKGDVSPTLRSQTHGHEPIILEKETMKTYALAGTIIGRKPQNGGNGGYREEVAYTMDTIGNFGIAQVEDDMEQQTTMQADGFKPRNSSSARSLGYENNNSPTIDTSQNVAIVVHGSQDPISNTEHANAVNRNNGLENCVCQYGESAGTLTERHDSSPCPDRGQNVVASHLSVRRLLPIECERLMGMPDNWTKIPWRGKPTDECPDAPRYKACGNSMGVNCMRWIGLGIEAVEAKHRK